MMSIQILGRVLILSVLRLVRLLKNIGARGLCSRVVAIYIV